MHNKGIVYRDVKPENFVIGRKSAKKNNRIYIIGDDTGLANGVLYYQICQIRIRPIYQQINRGKVQKKSV